MCEKVKDILAIAGGYRGATTGHLTELCDRTKIKKVVMEDKSSPSAGSGATNSVLDAVSLAS
ncbi:hypothetical protein BG015_001390 [Linnemannia schmuckeri]|uniref:Uncharacterized protein n=1 Tax=Linnemannia schmuckeri TaxID=64567 RepID=A0A9P5S626_9FUNG|nr:hypothetical protein BG015_001390 [Linnemannia schmuckeri]